MVNYEFYCRECDQTYELWLKMEDRKKPQICEECRNPLERMLSAPAIAVHGYSDRNGYGLHPEKASKPESKNTSASTPKAGKKDSSDSKPKETKKKD